MADSLNSPNISDLSEEQIIALFADSLSSADGIGIGDDSSVTEGPSGLKQFLSTDLIVEHVHFRRQDISAHFLGHKALAVNLSDIAAMGGRPNGFYLSLALPKELSVSWLRQFRDGLLALAKKHNILLLGGDTTRSQNDIIVNITITGVGKPRQVKLRSEAKVGDVLCVTGTLGDSAAGLKILSNPDQYAHLTKSERQQLLESHQQPKPEVEKGQWLSQEKAVHAMIDVSDGLLRDAHHIAQQSQCRLNIELEQLPLSQAFKSFYEKNGINKQAQEFAVAGGEDYRLLLAVAEDAVKDLQKRYKQKFSTILHQIGSVSKGDSEVEILRDGSPVEVKEQEFKHFKES
ncbi:thiamine-monophosphate kinase [Fodinibius salinus]|uniref:Thiamine-monophosphate kinase n=1 Tax=Fodinibius salinus TaxID=860790 RepID=A0A5D3YK68_9BACT|nr:thiamine-phosphate kinase [Fodinibius salinus]TYP93898.1 thiamine-monophosphate kinase [Fodinibius salinus]